MAPTKWPGYSFSLVLPFMCAALTERKYEEPKNGGGSTRAEKIVVAFHQMPVPSTTWIGIGSSGVGSSMDTGLDEWVGFTPGSIQLKKHNEEYEEWQPTGFSGYPSTGMNSDKFSAVSYSQEAGHQYSEDDSGKVNKPQSTINVGFTSYTIKEETKLREQAFFIQTPSWLRYILPACPNYAVGQTSPEACPTRTMLAGEWKFSVLGLLSGTDINSLNSAAPPSGVACSTEGGNTNCHASVKKDLANYKEIVYRTIVDVGGMGPDAEVYLCKNADKKDQGCVDGGTKTPIASITNDMNIADYTLAVRGTKKKDDPVPISFVKTYSTGTWTRKWEELTCTRQESAAQCSSNQCSFGKCTRDVTGFTASDDAYAGDNGDNSFQKAPKGSNGAPVLTTTDVREVNITIRPASMGVRPQAPGTCTVGNTHCWPNAPADVPWWYASKWNDPGSGKEQWGGTEEFQGYLHDRDKVMRCETGYCFFIDFHFKLGGTTEASRTVLGNPPNDLSTGISSGTFFVYDPTVDAGEAPFDPLFLLIGIAVTCCCCCFCGSCVIFFLGRRRRKQRQNVDPDTIGLSNASETE